MWQKPPLSISAIYQADNLHEVNKNIFLMSYVVHKHAKLCKYNVDFRNTQQNRSKHRVIYIECV